MNETQGCLQGDQLRRLMEGELAAAQVTQAEEHLSDCEHCRGMLEMAIGNAGWWQEARELLSHGGGDRLMGGDANSAHSDVLALLGPTDDPHMLGRIGTYEIVGILGRGGMGVVFKGFDGALNRFVAIKMLLPHLAASGAARKRFAREAQAAAAVVHDHVMAIHGVAEWQGVPYLVMPYGRGVSLQRRLSDTGPLEVREILRIGMQTAAGLAAAHAQGLVHRDVKPANILLDDGVERVTLTDFGLARAVDDANLTRSGTLAGTPQYMSPEQARAKSIDARSDLFSLGSVLYAMCTGRSPFGADSSYGVLRLISDEEPTPIRELNPEIPEWLCAIVSRLMAKQPEDRYSSASEVAELLERCLAHVQQPMAVALPSTLSHPRAMSESKRRENLLTGVLVMFATLGLGLLAMFVWQGESPPNISEDSLYGVWEVALEPDTLEPPDDQRHRFVFAGEWYATFRGSERLSVSRFKVDTEQTPKRISLIDGEGKSKRGIYEVKGDGLRLSLALETDALPTMFGPELKRAKGNLAQAQFAALKLHSTKTTANKADEAKATPQYVRQVPRHKLVVTCFIGEVDSKSNCQQSALAKTGCPISPEK